MGGLQTPSSPPCSALLLPWAQPLLFLSILLCSLLSGEAGKAGFPPGRKQALKLQGHSVLIKLANGNIHTFASNRPRVRSPALDINAQIYSFQETSRPLRMPAIDVGETKAKGFLQNRKTSLAGTFPPKGVDDGNLWIWRDNRRFAYCVSSYEDFGFHRLKASQNLFRTRRHRRRAPNWPKRLLGGFGHVTSQPETTTPPISKPETPVSTSVSTPEARPGCRCPEEAEVAKAQQGKAGEARRKGVRIPTPRTEEAAWAASALTFLLVTLTVAILYTRLHRKCRRGRSLYWTVSGEEDRETVAAVIKRRLLSSQIRRKKRPRQKQQELLVSTSSDSSD